MDLPESDEPILISIATLQGQRKHEIKSDSRKAKLHWNVALLPNGTYIYQQRSEKKLINTGKLSILH